MINEMLNHLLVLGGAVGLMGVAYIAWLVSGIGNTAVKDKISNWSWSRFGKDLLKAVCFTVSMAACSIVTDGLGYYVDKLEITQLSAFADVVSWAVVVVIPIVVGYYLLYRALKNNKSLVGYDEAAKAIGVGDDIRAVDNSAVMADVIKTVTMDYISKLTPKKAVEAQEQAEEEHDKEGGLGQSYVVPYNTYNEFRNATIGNGYDLDGAYGYQCWDFACLLWQQLGRWLYTGNGCASGCWTLKKEVNAGNDFDLIYNLNDVKRGDIVVFGNQPYGHIGYADEDYNGSGYIRLLGQNQSADMKACVVKISTSTFLGAFRFKKWIVVPAPTPEPAPTPTPSKFGVGDIVVPKKLVDYYGAVLKQWDDNYTITQIDGDRAVLCANRNGNLIVWAAMNTSNIKKA